MLLVLFLGWSALGFAESAQAIPATSFEDVQDNSPATSVTLTLVDGIAVGPEGNIYIAHRSKNRIRKITADGTITTVAGTGIAGFSGDGGPAVAAELNFPAGLALDSKGNLFIADRNNHRIRKVTPDGIITTVVGNGIADMMGDGGPALEASLNLPSDLAVDDAGSLYISDRSNNRVRIVDANGTIETVVGLGPAEYGGDFGLAEDALLKYPFGICLDSKGNLYIADRGNNRIRKVSPEGIISTVAGDGMHFFSGDYGPANQSSLAYPTDVVADDAGNLYISDRNNNRIRKVDSQGVITTFMGTGKPEFNGDREIAMETNLHLPFALAIDKKRQRLIVVDRSHFRVRSVDLKKHSVRTIAGNGRSHFKGDEGPGQGATLNSPSGLVVDSKGIVYFTEKNHNRIRTIDRNGIIRTFAGTGALGNEGDGGPALQAALYLPTAMTIDHEDNIYVTGRSGNGWIIRKIDAQGIISHFAGNGKQGADGDGGPAVDAAFYSVTDIATDRAGRVYISDKSNFSIRKIDKNGIITKVFGKESVKSGSEIHPNGLVVDEDGNIYFSDSGSSKIRRLGTDGKVETVAGSGEFKDTGDEGKALSAGIRSPGGLTLSPDGDLYVLEETSSVIRKIDRDGTITRVAGTGTPGFSGDGGPANRAQIKSPFRMSFDSQGNIYFSDRDNNRIRKIDTGGNIHTVAGHGNFGWLQDGLEVRITVHNFP